MVPDNNEILALTLVCYHILISCFPSNTSITQRRQTLALAWAKGEGRSGRGRGEGLEGGLGLGFSKNK